MLMGECLEPLNIINMGSNKSITFDTAMMKGLNR